MVKDINPGVADSNPGGLVAAGGALFFFATDGTTGRELWVTDGTTAGTMLTLDVNPTGDGALGTPFPIGVGKRVCAGLATGGALRLWVSDGTGPGTGRVVDFALAFNSLPSFAVLGSNLLFAADDNVVGMELWSIPLAKLGASTADSFGVSCKGSLNPTIGFSGAPALGNAAFAVTLTGTQPSAPCSLFLAGVRADLAFAGCTIYPSLVPTINFNTATDGSGSAALPMPIPSSPQLVGIPLFFQWAVVDLGGPILGVASLSDGLRISIGKS